MRITRPLAVIAALAVAGCGTTVQGVGTTAAQPDTQGGLTVPDAAAGSAAGAGTTTGSGSVAGGGAPSTSFGATGSTSGGGVTPAGPTGVGPAASAAALPTSGRGYDAKHIYLGFPTNTDVSDAAPKGIGATNFGDQVGQIKTVVADVNAHGGLLGRQVVPVYHDMKTADLETDKETQAEATCTAFTEDHPVVAVINIVATIDLDTFYACLAKHGTPLVTAGLVPVDDTELRTYAPYLYKLTAATFNVLAPLWLDRLTAMGYFHGWNTTTGSTSTGAAKVGLLYPNQQPQIRDFARLKSALVARGITVASQFEYDSSTLDSESRTMPSAVLRFRNAGVTHVLSSESDVLLFMEAADGQHYRPRYGLTSYHAAAPQLQGTVPATQLTGSMGIGWLPVSDVDSAHNPGPVGPGETACRQLMRKAGQDISSAGAALVAFALCDGVHLVVQGIAAVGNPAATAMREGISRVGSTFESALVWRSALSSSRADLPGSVREFAFNGSAYKYVSKQEFPL